MKYIIYKITIAEFVYIGSTKNYTRRKSQHKYFRNEYQANLNSFRCFRTDEQVKQYQQEYHQEYGKGISKRTCK